MGVGNELQLKRFGKAYKIVLIGADDADEHAGWELCAHRTFSRDQRTVTSTYASMHRPDDNRTCNHFELQRIDAWKMRKNRHRHRPFHRWFLCHPRETYTTCQAQIPSSAMQNPSSLTCLSVVDSH